MILCTLVGLAIQQFGNVDSALAGSFLIGLVVASFVPMPGPSGSPKRPAT